MPIHFRCCFCKQLLGIAQRKAGTVIDCPTCHGKIWVPADGEPRLTLPSEGPTSADVEPVIIPPNDRVNLTPARLFFLGLGLILLLALIVGVVLILLREGK
jgi:DNA-directed RNA polymerase subunit RPC12/RpoP